MNETKQVSQREFEEFIQGYQKPLKKDWSAMFMPPFISYNDFSDGKVWPQSVVAFIKDHHDQEKEYFVFETKQE